MKNYVFFANGFEEIEGLATVDILRRAGMDVEMIAVGGDKEGKVVGAHGVTVVGKDLSTVDISEADWMILPGGMPGATNLYESLEFRVVLLKHGLMHNNIAAICAAPAVVLAPLALLDGRKATCYPGFEAQLEAGGAIHTEGRVVVCENFVTANGPGSAFDFALKIVELACGKEKADEVAAGMLL